MNKRVLYPGYLNNSISLACSNSRKLLGQVFWFFAVLCLLPSTSYGGASYGVSLVADSDVEAMRKAIHLPGQFQTKMQEKRAAVDELLNNPISVPLPKDAGGGYTHEQHKRNYQHMYDAGLMFLLTEQQAYANYVRDMLLAYAAMYPNLPRHPKRKSSNEGKLFWQGLNEAVWLVYTIQAYDFVKESLSKSERQTIEQGVLRPVALFLSQESPHTFNKVHNHGTWANAAVGMTGYVIAEPEWVEWALYDLSKSGKGGFMRQLDTLFSPDGYYTEGPYYQRYALMPFVTFAKAIALNDPKRDIFAYRDGILLKAIETTLELSYNGLFFPLNDAIKSKGIDTIELVHGVALAYRLTNSPQLLDVAIQQNTPLLTGDGLRVIQDIAAGKAKPYSWRRRGPRRRRGRRRRRPQRDGRRGRCARGAMRRPGGSTVRRAA